MMQISAYGRLGGDPRSIDTQSGKAMAVASVAVEIPERGVEDPEPEWIGVVAFGGQADKLLQHAKGECLSVSGRVQRNRWTDRDGNGREQLQVVADALVSARTVRPGGGRKATSGERRSADANLGAVATGGESHGGRAPADAEPATAGREDFDDDIPY